MTARKEILETVKGRRGISFSTLKDETDRGNGTIQHHINSHQDLERKKDAIVHIEKCKECPLSRFCGDKCVKMLLENSLRKEILLKKSKGVQNNEIASKLGLHRSTVSYHLSKFSSLSKDFFETVQKEV